MFLLFEFGDLINHNSMRIVKVIAQKHQASVSSFA
jgi:hypothetical protein